MGEKPRFKVQVWIWTTQGDPARDYFLVLKTRPGRGGFWQPVTGGVQAREPVRRAALREAREETGLRFAGMPESFGGPFAFRKRGKGFIEHAFALRVRRRRGAGVFPKVKLDPKEHTEYEWLEGPAARRRVAYDSNKKQLDALRALLKASRKE